MDLNRSRHIFWCPDNKELENRAIKAINVEIHKWRGLVKAVSGAMGGENNFFFNFPILEEVNLYLKK